jgi:hypothetical protein
MILLNLNSMCMIEVGCVKLNCRNNVVFIEGAIAGICALP